MCFESDIAGVASLRNYFSNNPFIAYLDINSMRNKITHLEDVLSKSPINIMCVDETKVESKLKGIKYPTLKRDRNSKLGGKNVYITGGPAVRSTKNLETKNADIIFL